MKEEVRSQHVVVILLLLIEELLLSFAGPELTIGRNWNWLEERQSGFTVLAYPMDYSHLRAYHHYHLFFVLMLFSQSSTCCMSLSPSTIILSHLELNVFKWSEKEEKKELDSRRYKLEQAEASHRLFSHRKESFLS